MDQLMLRCGGKEGWGKSLKGMRKLEDDGSIHMMVSREYTYVKTYKIIYFKYVLCICQLYLDKVVF